MVTWQQIGQGEPNPFDVTYTNNSPYSASYGEFVITEGSQVDLPSPKANAAVAIRSFGQEVRITTPSGNIWDSSTTGKVNLNSPKYVILVSDGTNWYVQNNESGIGAAIPDSVVLNATAAAYDDTADEYVSNIGPNIPDGGGNPTPTTITDGNGDSVTAVRYDRYDGGSGDFSQVTSGVFPFSGISSQAIVYTAVNRSGVGQNSARYLDGGSGNEFIHAIADQDSGDPHRIATNGFSTTATGGSVTTNLQTFAIVDDGTDFELFKSSPTSTIISTGSDLTPLSGLTLAAEGDGTRPIDLDVVEVSVMKDQTASELSSEINRQLSEYGT